VQGEGDLFGGREPQTRPARQEGNNVLQQILFEFVCVTTRGIIYDFAMKLLP